MGKYISNSESVKDSQGLLNILMSCGLKVGKTTIFPGFLLARKYYTQGAKNIVYILRKNYTDKMNASHV